MNESCGLFLCQLCYLNNPAFYAIIYSKVIDLTKNVEFLFNTLLMIYTLSVTITDIKSNYTNHGWKIHDSEGRHSIEKQEYNPGLRYGSARL